MAQTMVSIRMDEDLKNGMDRVCRELGMNMTTAFTIFAKKVCREQRIPFDVSIDPFYTPANQRYLEEVTHRIDSGAAGLAEHDLIDPED